MTDWILRNPGNSVLELQDDFIPVNIWGLIEGKDHNKNFMFIVYKPCSHPIYSSMRISARRFLNSFTDFPVGILTEYIGWESGLLGFMICLEGGRRSAELFLFSTEFFWGKLYFWIKTVCVLKFPKTLKQQGLKNAVMFNSLNLGFERVIWEDISQTF